MDERVHQTTSHLPNWVLKMRQKIADSRQLHSHTEMRLGNLQASIVELGDKIEILRPKLNNDASQDDNVDSQKLDESIFFKFDNLPSDVLSQILRYLSVLEANSLQGVSQSFKQAIFDSVYFWYDMFYIYCPHLKRSSSSQYGNMRSSIISHVKITTECVKFIRTMKEQRSILRHNTIAPRRHSVKEKTVTHPLPLFEQSKPNEVGKMMSRAETFSSDFRSVAHRVLGNIFRITGNPDDPLHEQLTNEGAVTVLVSMLSNEAGALQNYSCGILANMLVWESRKEKRLRRDELRGFRVSSPSTPAESSSASADAGASRVSVADQVMACNGHRMLIGLLTSPTA